jgi:hypothetical protein
MRVEPAALTTHTSLLLFSIAVYAMRASAGQHLVEHDAEGPDVRALVGRPSFRLLRRHVRRGSDHHPRDRACLAVAVAKAGRAREGRRVQRGGTEVPPYARGIDRLSEAEIEHLHGAVVAHLDIGGLQIAVNDAALVSLFDGVRDLARDAERLLHRQRAAADALGEILAVHELHDERVRGPLCFDAVDLRDMRVIERSEQMRFALEPREPFRIRRKDARQDLDGDVAIELRIARAIDLAHASGTDGADDFVGTEAATS